MNINFPSCTGKIIFGRVIKGQRTGVEANKPCIGIIDQARMMSMRGQSGTAINMLTGISGEKAETDQGKARFQTAVQIVGNSDNYRYRLRVAVLGVRVEELEQARGLFRQVEDEANDKHRTWDNLTRDLILGDMASAYLSMGWEFGAMRIVDSMKVNDYEKRNWVRKIAYRLQDQGENKTAEEFLLRHQVDDLRVANRLK